MELQEPDWGDTPFGRLSARLFREATVRWRQERRRYQVWMQVHYGLGVIGVVLAALAGFGSLSDFLGQEAAAFVALMAAVAGGLATFLKTDKMQDLHEALAVEWDILRDDVVTLWETRPSVAPATGRDPEGWQRLLHASSRGPTISVAGRSIIRNMRLSSGRRTSLLSPWLGRQGRHTDAHRWLIIMIQGSASSR